MPFSFSSDALVDSATVSNFFYQVPDAVATAECPAEEKFFVEFAINAASEQIISFCSRKFKQATYTEVFDGQEADLIIPKHYPITGITSVKFASNHGFSTATPIDDAAYNFDEEYIYLTDGVLTPRGRGLVQVIYQAGYATIPYAVQQACIIQAQYLLKFQGKEGNAMLGYNSVGKMGEQASRDVNIGEHGLVAEVIGMLLPYKRMEAPLSVMFNRVY
jgi:hypothetical protein